MAEFLTRLGKAIGYGTGWFVGHTDAYYQNLGGIVLATLFGLVFIAAIALIITAIITPTSK